MTDIIHSNMTDLIGGLHNPKGFVAAPNSSTLTKDASGSLVWDDTEFLEAEKLGCFGYLGTPTNTIFAAPGWLPAEGVFTFPTCIGFSYTGTPAPVYDGIVYTHPVSHYIEVNLSATVQSSAVNTIVRLGYGVNSNTTPVTGTINSTKCVATGTPYTIGINFVAQVDPNDELTLMMYSDKAATITLDTCQITSSKFFQAN